MAANNARPRLSLLTGEQKQQVHQNALHVLSTTGVRVDSPAVLALLRSRLGAGRIDGTIVRLPAESVEQAIRSAPARVDIFDRRGQPAFTPGDGRMHFGIGVTALYYLDPLTDALEPFTRRHMRDMVRLGGRLPHYECISTVGIVQDVPSQLSDLYGSLEMIANTTKPLVLLISEDALFPRVLDMFESLAGDLGGRPFVIPYLNPLSPLVMNAGTLDKMAESVRRGLPVIFSSYSMAGMSTPLTAAGTLSLLLAELLAGLVISQTLKPGAPILLGMLPNFFDMKTMQSFYDPQSFLINIACAEMMEHYGLPHCGTSGSGTGWGTDLSSADTYWMNTLTCSLAAGGGLAPFVGDTLGAKAFGPNTVVYIHEVIDQALRVAGGFQLDEAASVLDEIAAAGPNGSFLNAPSTRRNFKSGYYPGPLFPRWSMEKWQAEGQPRAEAILRQRTRELIETTPAPEDHDALLAQGEAFIASEMK